MRIYKVSYPFLLAMLCLIVLASCHHKTRNTEAIIVASPEELDKKATENIHESLDYAVTNNGNLGDSLFLFNAALLKTVYERNQFAPVWCTTEKWKPLGDSLLNFITAAKLYGLFPEDYHFVQLDAIRKKFLNDSLGKTDRRDASIWSDADVLLTDAYVHIIKDIKLGRLAQDSITLRKDSVLSDDFYEQQLNLLLKSGSVTKSVHYLEPKQMGYESLKAGIQKFLDSADDRPFSLVPSRTADPVKFNQALQHRLYEAGFLSSDSTVADSLQLATAIKQFQTKKGITVDGKAGEGTIRVLNTSDKDKFIRIAISMDKYKMLPEKMPEKYIWVNLPGYYMQLWQNDSVKLFSKVVCGKPLTKTPQLNSNITEMVTYPQWTVPTSIILKEILPAIKKNPGYLARKGFSLVDKNGDEVDPYTVDWSKYSKGIPYKVVQGSGDANALGIFKFNFSNKYSVYLHDTNQRYLFGLATRDLSHGCVRVQEWEKLAYFILRNDSLNSPRGSYTKADSVRTWLKRKEKHSIAVRNRIPLFIRYFTCEGKDGNIIFYDDIYGEDKKIREKYFVSK